MIEDWIEKIKENKLVVGLVLAIVVLAGALFLNLANGNGRSAKSQANFPSMASTSQTSQGSTSSASSSEKSGVIVVDVKGAVKKEGVYELPAGSRVTDAIEKAGGFTDKANKKSVNLAQKLEDQAVVYVAAQGEDVEEVTGPGSSSGGISDSNRSSHAKVNLNTASKEELQTISGIGEKRAQNIIDYREEHGGFKSVEELKNISGIGDKTYEKIAPEVTV